MFLSRVLRRSFRRSSRFLSSRLESIHEFRLSVIRIIRRWLRRWLGSSHRYDEPRAWSRRKRWIMLFSLAFAGLLLLGVYLVYPTRERMQARYRAAFEEAMRSESWATALLCAERLSQLHPDETTYRYWALRLRAKRESTRAVIRPMRELSLNSNSVASDVDRWLVELTVREPDLLWDDIDSFDEGLERWRRELEEATTQDQSAPRLMSLSAISAGVGDAEGLALIRKRLEPLVAVDSRHALHLSVVARLQGDITASQEYAMQRWKELELPAESSSLEGKEVGVEGAICLMLAGRLHEAQAWIAQVERGWSPATRSQVLATLAQLRVEESLRASDTTSALESRRWLVFAWSQRSERQSLVSQTEKWLQTQETEDQAQELDDKEISPETSVEQQAAEALIEGLVHWRSGSHQLAEQAWRVVAQSDYGVAILNNFAWWTLCQAEGDRERAKAMLDVAIQMAEERGSFSLLASLLETRSRLYHLLDDSTAALQDLRRSEQFRNRR